MITIAISKEIGQCFTDPLYVKAARGKQNPQSPLPPPHSPALGGANTITEAKTKYHEVLEENMTLHFFL